MRYWAWLRARPYLIVGRIVVALLGFVSVADRRGLVAGLIAGLLLLTVPEAIWGHHWYAVRPLAVRAVPVPTRKGKASKMPNPARVVAVGV